MTREEEIENKAIEHVKNCMELCNHYSIDESDLEDVFADGAEWADKHPINVWHDTNEEPRLNQWFLAQIGDNAFDTFVMEMDKNEDWKEWSNGVNIKRWAYIKDLLPKGGEK